MEALLKKEPQAESSFEVELPQEEEAKPEVFVPTDDYELLSYIIEQKGQVPEEIWQLYERFKTENPMAFSLYASEIEEIEELKREVRK